MRGTMLCDNCWEVSRRVDAVARSKAGRKLLRKALRPYNPLAIWFEREPGMLHVHTRYWVLRLDGPRKWARDWGHWRPKKAEARNWCRFRAWWFFGAFEIKGWHFWGRKPDDK
jgi:hypothetical protein